MTIKPPSKLASINNHANPLYPPDALLIRASVSSRPDPVTAAIAHHISESGSVFPAADQGGYLVDIEVEDTGIPVSEDARYRRFPSAGRPVQVYESCHLRQATFASPTPS